MKKNGVKSNLKPKKPIKDDDDMSLTTADIEIADHSDAESIIVCNRTSDNDAVITSEAEQKLKPDEYGLTPIAVFKKNTYTEASRLAQQKYREKYPEKYCELQKKIYNDNKKNEEWRKHFNERSAKNNKIWRDKKNAEIIASGGTIKSRGRPKKPVPETPVEEPAVAPTEPSKKRGRPKKPVPEPPVEVPIQNIELPKEDKICDKCLQKIVSVSVVKSPLFIFNNPDKKGKKKKPLEIIV